MRWFKNLKKWQKGGLIGCAVGILLTVIILLSPHQDSLGEWIEHFHGVFFWLSFGLALSWVGEGSRYGAVIVDYGGLAAIVIFYGVLGMLLGRVQQMTNPIWKWLLTALLALFLLGFYVMHVI